MNLIEKAQTGIRVYLDVVRELYKKMVSFIFRRNICLWEMLIPVTKKNGEAYSLKHHSSFISDLRNKFNGLTVMTRINGNWVSGSGSSLQQNQNPIRIFCTKKEIYEIVGSAIEFYGQDILVYLVSNYLVFGHQKQ